MCISVSRYPAGRKYVYTHTYTYIYVFIYIYIYIRFDTQMCASLSGVILLVEDSQKLGALLKVQMTMRLKFGEFEQSLPCKILKSQNLSWALL